MTNLASTDLLSSAALDRVAHSIRAAGAEIEGPLEARLIAGGRSNLTFKLTDRRSHWVMRMPPLSGRTPSAHDVAREFKVTSALATVDFPVPNPVVLGHDDPVVGGPFAIADFVDGETIQTRTRLDELDDYEVARISRQLVGTLAHLHQVDIKAAGLSDFGRPDGYAERQLTRWASQWEIVGTADLADLGRKVIDRLNQQVPEQRHSAVIHGDFRIDNTILDLDADRQRLPRIAAVVDWELSTIGDPIADVAMMCAYRHSAFDLIVGESSAWGSPRLPGPLNLAAEYEAAGGVALDDWEFHLALAYFKIGVIAAGIAHRASAGGMTGPGFDTAGESVLLYLQLAQEALGARA